MISLFIKCSRTSSKTTWCSLKKAKTGAQQWRNAQESLISLENKNVAAVDSIVRFAAFLTSFDTGFSGKFIANFSSIRGGTEAIETLRARFSYAVSAALEDADIANRNMLSSIDRQYLFLHAC